MSLIVLRKSWQLVFILFNIPRKIWEAIHIRQCRDRTMNRDIGLEVSYVWDSVFYLIWLSSKWRRCVYQFCEFFVSLVAIMYSYIHHCIYNLSVSCVYSSLMKVSVRKPKRWKSNSGSIKLRFNGMIIQSHRALSVFAGCSPNVLSHVLLRSSKSCLLCFFSNP